jgi:putative restriction endonuclease
VALPLCPAQHHRGKFLASWRTAVFGVSVGEPFFFRLKSPINRIGGFGLFARDARLPVWRAWEVFGHANGVQDEGELLERLARLARRPVTRADLIGCVAVAECTFFAPDDWLAVPSSFRPQNLSGSLIDLDAGEGRELWRGCLARAAAGAFRRRRLVSARERRLAA